MTSPFSRHALRAILSLLFFVAVASWSGRASAYGWMIQHDYTGCNQCHADPSGGGLLTAYGRAQSEVLLRSHYSKWADDEEPGKLADFALGIVKLPETLLLGGDYRLAWFSNKVGDAKATTRFIQMQADLEGQLSIDRFRVNATLGYDHSGAQAAAITTRDLDNVVSRVHWVGFDLGEDRQFLLRAGRMNLPFGLRTIEHTMFIHAPPAIPGGGVRNDTNQGQQDGVALAYNGAGLRGEAMLIAGNYQVNPDVFRERGYSAYVEWAPDVHVAVGASSLITYAGKDALVQTPLIRQAHGLFARVAPFGHLVLLGELDALLYSQPADQVTAGQPTLRGGFAGMLQADFEVWQGLHLMLTGETTKPPVQGVNTSYAGWGSVAWFFAPHSDVRLDAIQQSFGLGPTNISATSVLAQVHFFL